MRVAYEIPPRFRSEVSKHLTLSYTQMPDHPLILGIFGPPGEGKTFQLAQALMAAGVGSVTINAADLESDRAGRPGKLVLEQYVTASHSIARGVPTALVVNDIDTTVGEWEKNTGTVNHQQLLAQLMHLADSPLSIPGIGPVRRVPVIVTGNDPAKLYAPLRRAGRMKIFVWEPTPAEKRGIVHSLLSDIAPAAQIDQVLRRFDRFPVSYYSQLKADVLGVLAESLLPRLDNFGRVIAEPEKYARYIMAMVSRDAVDLMDLAEKAAKEQQNVQKSYLDNGKAMSADGRVSWRRPTVTATRKRVRGRRQP